MTNFSGFLRKISIIFIYLFGKIKTIIKNIINYNKIKNKIIYVYNDDVKVAFTFGRNFLFPETFEEIDEFISIICKNIAESIGEDERTLKLVGNKYYHYIDVTQPGIVYLKQKK